MVGDDKIDITTATGYKWLQNNLLDEEGKDLYRQQKPIERIPMLDKFKLIESGAVITKGDLFDYFDDLMEMGKEKNGF